VYRTKITTSTIGLQVDRIYTINLSYEALVLLLCIKSAILLSFRLEMLIFGSGRICGRRSFCSRMNLLSLLSDS